MVAVSAAGAALALYSVLSLGRSFSILPSRRQLVTHGPYRWVRHSAHLGQWIVVLGCAPALEPSWWGILLATGLLPWLALRMLAEEHLLAENETFAAYFERVQWRMVPGVW